MEQLKIYYQEKNDSVLYVLGEEVMGYDEYVSGIEFYSYFEIENIYDFKRLTREKIKEGYEYIQLDFELYSSKEEVKQYKNRLKNRKIEGELITIK